MSPENPSVMLPEKLKAAMDCLDLSLDAELALYRRHQEQRQMLAELPDIEHKTLGASELQSPPLSSELELANLPATLAIAPSKTVLDASVSVPQPSTSDRLASPASPPVFSAEVLSASASLGSASADELETLPESYSAELTAQPQAFDRFLDPSIEDYLESSEALLKHLDEPAQPDIEPVKPAAKKAWVVKAGFALIILGLVGLAGFFAILATRWFAPKPRSVSPSPQSSAPPIQQLPVPRAEVATEGIPTSERSPIAPPTGVVLSPRLSPSLKSSPLAFPASPPLDPNAAHYVVIAAYSSPESLQQAQKLVPEAYVTTVKGQERIQLAFSNSLQEAQQLVNELRNQGLPATIVAQN